MSFRIASVVPEASVAPELNLPSTSSENIMKPISTLKIYQTGRTPAQVLTNILAITKNPKRHLRGPRYGLEPGSGRIQMKNNAGTAKTAVCGCGNGLIDMLSRGGRKGNVAYETRQLLDDTAFGMYAYGEIQSHATVSDQKGLKAWLRVVRKALKNVTP